MPCAAMPRTANVFNVSNVPCTPNTMRPPFGASGCAYGNPWKSKLRAGSPCIAMPGRGSAEAGPREHARHKADDRSRVGRSQRTKGLLGVNLIRERIPRGAKQEISAKHAICSGKRGLEALRAPASSCDEAFVQAAFFWWVDSSRGACGDKAMSLAARTRLKRISLDVV